LAIQCTASTTTIVAGRWSSRSLEGMLMLSCRATALKGALALLLVSGSVSVDAAIAQRATRPLPSADETSRPTPHQTRPLPEIVAQVQSRAPYNDMDYIGVVGFETHTMVYILRFLDGRQVIVVRVDGRSGRIINPPPPR
jgi:hypothetical protein